MSKLKLKPIPFSSFGGYRTFCDAWWKDLWRTITYGWWHDVKTYWHRARYGWAPRDTWSLDHYLARVMGGSINYLAKHVNGAPYGYNNLNPDGWDVDTDFEKWEADLKRWSEAFSNYANDNYYELYKDEPNYDKRKADEKARSEALHQALKEMEPWFEGLWD